MVLKSSHFTPGDTFHTIMYIQNKSRICKKNLKLSSIYIDIFEKQCFIYIFYGLKLKH